MPRPSICPAPPRSRPRPVGHPKWSPTPASTNPRRPASGALGLAGGTPAPGAGSLLAHSAALAAVAAAAAASACAAPQSPDSVRPGRGRAPRAGLAGAALRAAADSRAGSARGLPGQGPGGGWAAGARALRGTASILLGRQAQ